MNTYTPQTMRLGWIDDIKMFAMLTVIFSHCLCMYVLDIAGYNLVGDAIRAFNIHLFMLMAGYTSCRSLHAVDGWGKYKDYVVKIAVRLLLPTFAIGALRALLTLDPHALGNEQWFLKMLFRCLLIYATCWWLLGELRRWLIRKGREKLLSEQSRQVLAWVVFAVLMLTTSSKLSEFCSYFLVGLWLKQWSVIVPERVASVKGLLVSLAVVVLGVVLIYFTFPPTRSMNFYDYPFKQLVRSHQLGLFCLRQACGFGWCMVFVPLFLLFSKKYTWFSQLGSKTLGLYIMHTFLLHLVVERLPLQHWLNTQGWVAVTILFVLLTVASLMLIWLFERNKYTRLVFLGQK